MEFPQPKFEVGQEVEAQWNSFSSDYIPATITNIKVAYTVRFNKEGFTGHYQRGEDEIRLPKPSPEQAWEKAIMVIGARGAAQANYCCLDGDEVEDFNRETRHQAYQILGAASIRITDEVKRDVRRLIGIANDL